MALAYIPPGVTVQEVVNPTFSPLLAEPTSICIVGDAQGFETNTEVVVLNDQDPVTLALDGIDQSTLTVVDASDPSGTAFTVGLDYDFDSSSNVIQRAMQTRISNGEEAVVYYENPAGVGYTEFATLNGLVGYAPQNRGTTLVPSNIFVQHEGILPTSDYIITIGSPNQIRVSDSPSVLNTTSRQQLYVDFDFEGDRIINVALVLNGTTNINLPDGENYVIKNAPTSSLDAAFLYVRGTTTDQDYILTGLSSSNTGESVVIQRSPGSTSMGVSDNKLQVRISYSATPSDYFLPTRVFSQSDVEAKYGPALDSFGSVNSPVSLAASLAFSNGASDMVIQALFHLANVGDDDSVKTLGGTSSDVTINLQDWQSTLRALRSIEDVNVLVPIVSAGVGASNDSLTVAIFQAIQSHVAFMNEQNQYLIALLGEDSTAVGNVADKQTLQAHAQTLGSSTVSEATVLLSPAAFSWANPVTGTPTSIGGQYVQAGVAGVMAANEVESSLLRKQVAGIIGIKDFRSEMDKNADAASGLMVIETKQGVVRVRDAVTTNTQTVNARELNVVRAKHFMIESIRDSLDSQIIGQVIIDDVAPFQVQLAVSAVLEELISQGIIVTYQDVQAQTLATDPTAIEVRYSYLPAYAIKYINVVFSINTSNGVIETDLTQGA